MRYLTARRMSKRADSPPARSFKLPKKQTSWRSRTANVLPACEPVRVLGEGTFGTVVLVRERSTRQFFAVKVMNKYQLEHESQLDNIVLERQVLRDAGPHPFVVECHSGFQTHDAVVLVLEYLSGGDMYDLMRAQGTMAEAQARFYLAETVVGIAELHRHSFVFRDLKLENILIDDRGHVRLTDFGLAGRAVTAHWDDRSIVDISGTAIYQAPEILSGSGHGFLVDWWALGVLAYVLLTGRPPFPNQDSREKLHDMIQHKELDLDADDRLQHVSPACRDFIRMLLQKSPAMRLGSKNDAEDVKGHEFFCDVDFDALLNFEEEPPFPPPRRGPSNDVEISAEDARDAQRRMLRKLEGKQRPLKRRMARLLRKRRTKLCEQEYKPVSIPSSPMEAPCFSSPEPEDERRISIGLDFDGRDEIARTKTWTGTMDDFGRKFDGHYPSSSTGSSVDGGAVKRSDL